MNIIRFLLICITVGLTVYLVTSQIDQSASNQNAAPVQSTPAPKSLTEYQACLDRVNNSEAEESLIEESRRECEKLYIP